MTAEPNAPGNRQSTRFLLLYALAYAGGFVAYVPFLTILLPVKMAVAAGDLKVEWLAAATLLGAIAASIANIAFGWASDLTRSRRPWIAAGLALTVAAYGLIHFASTPAMIVAAIVGWQITLNLMLAPLAALAADHVPDAQKGVLAGLLGAGQPFGSVAAIVVTLPGIEVEAVQFAVICAMFAAMVLPLFALHPRPIAPEPPVSAEQRLVRRRDLTLIWFARLFVQVACGVLFSFFLYYFQSLPGETVSVATVARTGGVTMLVAIPLALLLGRASDRIGARRPFLIGAALAMALGLGVMGATTTVPVAIMAYGLFGCASSIFLALQAVYTMQLLPSPNHRGRDLGLFNLTNTLPQLLSPVLAVTLVSGRSFATLMGTLALLAVGSAVLVLLVRSER
ncbi:MFS transporter [Sphingomonas gilva]|uniref:MFS transporter n=1 Tax=Sphingomonas gilva TaxID=2305907 RepID=UPI0015F9C395|nr:MFS transporter [Sphingomonas gilva]